VIRASIGFEQLLACEVAERQILYLPTMPYRHIPLAEANSVIVAEAYFKMILVDPEILFNAVYSHSCLSCTLFLAMLSPAQQCQNDTYPSVQKTSASYFKSWCWRGDEVPCSYIVAGSTHLCLTEIHEMFTSMHDNLASQEVLLTPCSQVDQTFSRLGRTGIIAYTGVD